MDKNINNEKAFNILKNKIYDNYLHCQKKFQDKNEAYRQATFAIYNLLKNDNYLSFTRTNHIRSTIQTAFPSPQDCKHLILDDFIDSMLNSPMQSPEEMNLFNSMITTLHSRGKSQLMSALNTVIKNNDYSQFSRFYNNDKSINYRQLLQETLSAEDITRLIANTMMNTIILEKQAENIYTKLQTQHPNKIDNFRLVPSTINQCKQDIQNGKQLHFKRRDYSVGNDLYASIDMGNKRKNQEDSVILLTHPKNPDFKMLVVADGAGGSDAGELASSYITSHMSNWFESLNSQYFAAENIGYLRYAFEQEIQNVSRQIYQHYHKKAYSTFVGAIVADKETLISNVGDSRAYICSQGNLHQVTEDDSYSYDLWKQGKIKEKSNIRFHKQSNLITQAMGLQEDVIPHTLTLSNKSYDTLLLFSDGITDCLSDRQIMAITQSTPREDLAKALVNAAKANDSVKNSLDPNEYNNFILGGKDNTTAAVYDNHSKKSKDEGR